MIPLTILVLLTFAFGFGLGNRNPQSELLKLALLSCTPAFLLLAYGLLMLSAFGERSVASFLMYRGFEWMLSFGSVSIAGVLGVARGQSFRRGRGEL